MQTGRRVHDLRSSFLILASLLLATACATGYHASGFSGGYSETRLADNQFTVYFMGNGFTSPERSADFALLRSAEVTRKHGFNYFVIAGAENTSTVTGGKDFVLSLPSNAKTIVCFKDKPDGVPISYDANYIYASLTAKYDIDQPRPPSPPVRE
jgi:hypothetical protein